MTAPTKTSQLSKYIVIPCKYSYALFFWESCITHDDKAAICLVRNMVVDFNGCISSFPSWRVSSIWRPMACLDIWRGLITFPLIITSFLAFQIGCQIKGHQRRFNINNIVTLWEGGFKIFLRAGINPPIEIEWAKRHTKEQNQKAPAKLKRKRESSKVPCSLLHTGQNLLIWHSFSASLLLIGLIKNLKTVLIVEFFLWFFLSFGQ